MKKIALLLVFVFAAPFIGFSQEEKLTDVLKDVPKKIYITKQISGEKPSIDGLLNDAAWDAVEWGGDFQQLESNDGGAPVVPTQFKIL